MMVANLVSAARVDLAQYAAFIIEENLSLAKDTYNQRMLEIGRDLKHGIEGLTSAMEYFSNQGHLESLPLSVSVPSSNSNINKLTNPASDTSVCP